MEINIDSFGPADQVFTTGKKLDDTSYYKHLNKVEGIVDIGRQFLESFHDPELARKVNIERAKQFVEMETGEKVTSLIYIVDQKNKKRIEEDMNYDGIEPGAFYDADIHASVVYLNDNSPILDVESKLAHELAHSTGKRVGTLDIGEDISYESRRLGLKVSGQGDFLEEMFAASVQQRYVEKYADSDFFSAASIAIGQKTTSFEGMEEFVFDYPDVDETVEVPVKYANLFSEQGVVGQSDLAAYSFDLLDKKVANTTGENLKVLMMDARKDPHNIPKLAQTIDNVIGKGTYQRLRTTGYGNFSDLKGMITTTKFLQSVI
ncbi:MAG TPA: hypothetical protein VL401_02810 [Alphaproteobacteria bacterium]|jgi:hypothetical protein|nr:hypothetical protein [Alphaproteobacteria bacterium]